MEFEKTPTKDIPPILEDYFRSVAKTGKTLFPWQHLKTAFIQKVESVMEQFNKEDPCDHLKPVPNVEKMKFDEMRLRILDAMQRFTGAPFTVQRICELVTQPKKHYTQCDKFMRGIEKNVMVVSTVDPAGRKIVSESRSLPNGLDSNGLNPDDSNETEIKYGKPLLPASGAGSAANNVDISDAWPEVEAEDSAEDEKNNSSSTVGDSVSNTETAQDIKNETETSKASGDNSQSKENLVVTDSVRKDSAPLQASAVSSATELEEDSNNSSRLGDDKEDTPQEHKSVEQLEDSVLEEKSQPLTVAGSCDSENQSENKESDISLPSKHPSDSPSAECEPPEKKLKVEEPHPENLADEARVEAGPDIQGEKSEQQEVLTDDKTADGVDDSHDVSSSEAASNEETDNKTATEDDQSKYISHEDADQSESSLDNSVQPESENTDMNESSPVEELEGDLGDEESCDSTGFPTPLMEEDGQDDTGAIDGGAGLDEVMDTEPVDDKSSKEEGENVVDQTSVDESEPMDQE